MVCYICFNNLFWHWMFRKIHFCQRHNLMFSKNTSSCDLGIVITWFGVITILVPDEDVTLISAFPTIAELIVLLTVASPVKSEINLAVSGSLPDPKNRNVSQQPIMLLQVSLYVNCICGISWIHRILSTPLERTVAIFSENPVFRLYYNTHQAVKQLWREEFSLSRSLHILRGQCT